VDTLWTVEQRIAAPALDCFQFSQGTRHGIPWRRDSVYLPIDDFALLEPTLRVTVRWFHAHGVTLLSADAAMRLAGALRARAADAAPGRGAVLATALGAWIVAQAADGLTIERW
jgi:hypothetical protein